MIQLLHCTNDIDEVPCIASLVKTLEGCAFLDLGLPQFPLHTEILTNILTIQIKQCNWANNRESWHIRLLLIGERCKSTMIQYRKNIKTSF